MLYLALESQLLRTSRNPVIRCTLCGAEILGRVSLTRMESSEMKKVHVAQAKCFYNEGAGACSARDARGKLALFVSLSVNLLPWRSPFPMLRR